MEHDVPPVPGRESEHGCSAVYIEISLRRIQTGGDERDRTAGLLRARQALSQLSYTPRDETWEHAPTFTYRYKIGGHRWIRTTDLTLIRRAL